MRLLNGLLSKYKGGYGDHGRPEERREKEFGR